MEGTETPVGRGAVARHGQGKSFACPTWHVQSGGNVGSVDGASSNSRGARMGGAVGMMESNRRVVALRSDAAEIEIELVRV